MLEDLSVTVDHHVMCGHQRFCLVKAGDKDPSQCDAKGGLNTKLGWCCWNKNLPK